MSNTFNIVNNYSLVILGSYTYPDVTSPILVCGRIISPFLTALHW